MIDKSFMFGFIQSLKTYLISRIFISLIKFNKVKDDKVIDHPATNTVYI